MVDLVTEVLMLQFLQAVRQQARPGEQHHRERRLHDDEDLLRDRRAVARGAVCAAQRLRRIGMRGKPRRRSSKEHARDQR